jgi:hypothetical protein
MSGEGEKEIDERIRRAFRDENAYSSTPGFREFTIRLRCEEAGYDVEVAEAAQ